MSNAELIERLGDYINNTDDCHLRKEAAEALELADKRIAEEREQNDRMLEEGANKLYEAERKLSVAREALKAVVAMPRSAESIRRCTQALAQIGGEDAGS